MELCFDDENPKTSLATPKIRAMNFMKQLFHDRGYQDDKNAMIFDQQHNMWELITSTQKNEKVMAVFADCKVFGDVMEIEEFEPVINLSSPFASMQNLEKNKMQNGQNMGMDVIKSLLKFSQSQKIKILILVTDFMTTHAAKHVMALKNLQFTHFTYDEAGIENMPKHNTQPVVFRALTELEKAEFIKKHPCYERELGRYGVDDALVKYYGMQLGDIIYIEDNDGQTGLVIDHGLVVQDL